MADIPSNVRLARDVGWPDTDGDWRVVHEGAIVVGLRAGASLVAQGALGLYGGAGTIAKMIVAPRFQRRGLGEQILKALLDQAERRSMEVLGLIATPFGRPLYERWGFRRVGDVVGLAGTPAGLSSSDEGTSPKQLEELLRLDQRCLGCSREAMLRARFREAVAVASVAKPDGDLGGYALATGQGAQCVVGPVIADTEVQARALVQAIFRNVSGPVRIDVPGEQAEFLRWLCELGLREDKRRSEMARGSQSLPWQVPERFALAAQAWG